jgi:KAP family P-loop domain
MTETHTPLWPDNPTAQDLLGFTDIADPIEEALLRDRLDPVAIGVFGDWGSGKSTVLEILRDRFDRRDRVVVVYTRPWEYDPNIDPKATLIAEVLAAVRAEVAKDQTQMAKVAERFKGLISRVQWSKAITLAANSALTLRIPEISDIVGIFGGASEDGLSDPTLQGFRDEFDELMGELYEIDRVVVLVDDLDAAYQILSSQPWRRSSYSYRCARWGSLSRPIAGS